jgi:hypothetical protein
MSCGGSIQCPPIPVRSTARRLVVVDANGVGFHLDLHYLPVELVVDCGNLNLDFKQQFQRAVTFSDDGTPVVRAYACF